MYSSQTSSHFSELIKEAVAGIPQAIKEGENAAAEAISIIFVAIWPQIWPYLLGLFVLRLLFALYDAARGSYSAIGSLVYHSFYLSFIVALILIKGWGIIFDSSFEFLNLAFYHISYKLTGKIFGWSGRNRRRY